MTTKTVALLVAASLAGSAGAAKAQYADAIGALIDLPTLADMILADLAPPPGSPYALAIGLSIGIAFSSDSVSFADSLAEGLVATGQGGLSWADVEAFAGSFATPGLAAANANIVAIIALLPPNPPSAGFGVSPD